MPEELPASALKRRIRLQPARYANIEAGNLLRRIQADEGIAMLTTNLRHDLYPANRFNAATRQVAGSAQW